LSRHSEAAAEESLWSIYLKPLDSSSRFSRDFKAVFNFSFESFPLNFDQ